MNDVTQLAQIVPRLASMCGVGDYAHLLSVELQHQQKMRSCFLIVEENWAESFQKEGQKFRLSRRSNQENWADLEGQPLAGMVLQYSGYGYARRGAPVWLLRTLRSFRSRFPQVPMITMFHEVAASGPVSSSAFWLLPVQRYVARRLRVLSDISITNCAANARELERLSDLRMRGLEILPVFSNFGEGDGMPWTQRVRRMVVFSSNFGGQVPACSFWQELADAACAVNATEVTIIGRPVKVPPDFNCPVMQPGFLESEAVSAILATSAFGYVFHGLFLLGKSGIFAAFAAHGVVPLVQTSSASLPDGLVGGMTYHALRHARPMGDNAAYFEQIRRNILEWYRPHNLAATAAFYAGLLERHQFHGERV